jgi:hypothetical protein
VLLQEEFSEDATQEPAAAAASEAYPAPTPYEQTVTKQPMSAGENRSYGTIGGDMSAPTSGQTASGYQAS